MNILSLDVETYGAVHGLPRQTTFHPRRSAHVDGVSPPIQLQVVSIVPCSPLPVPLDLSRLTPTSAFAFPLTPHTLPLTHNADKPVPSHLLEPLRVSRNFSPRTSLKLLCRWLSWADALVGMNLPFDIAYLRHHHPALRSLLDGRHLLLDLSYINFLECDSRPERSLKTLGPVLSTHTYDPETTARDHRFRSFSSLAFYCAQDSWNTVLAIRELARRIHSTPRMGGDKLSPFCLAFYSDTLWSCIEMSDHGVPFHVPSLLSLATTQLTTIAASEQAASPSLLLSGPGSVASKKALLDAAVLEIGPSVLDDPLLQFTEKRHELSFSDANRSLLKSRLATDSPLRSLFELADRHSAAQKLLSSYCYPLLWSKRMDATVRTSLLCPIPGVPPCPIPPPPPTTPTSSSPTSSSTAPTSSSRPPSPTSSPSSPPGASPTTPPSSSSPSSSPDPTATPSSVPTPSSSTSAPPKPPTSTPATPPASPPNPPIPPPSTEELPCPNPMPPPPTSRPSESSLASSALSMETPSPLCASNDVPIKPPLTSSAPPVPPPSPTTCPCAPSPNSSSTPNPLTSTTLPPIPISSPPSPTTPLTLPKPSSKTPTRSRPRRTPSILRDDVHLSHPSWFVTPSSTKDGAGSSGGTLQSRITCKNAAHQTDPPPIENCRTSRFRHGAILSFDLSQIELRVAALLSGDPFYVNAYTLNQDLHVRQAIRIWGAPELISRYPSLAPLPLDSWKKVHVFDRRERQVGKRVNFSHLFRAGASKMQASVHADINELFPLHLFEAIVSSRQSELPLLWEWQERILAEARATGRVLLPFTGQSRSFLGGTDYDVNEIVNFPIQTTASNTLLRIAVRLRHLLRTHRLTTTVLPFLNVYDALKFDCATPSALSSLRTLIPEAVAHVESHEYWSWLQDLHGRRIPLQYSIEEHHAHEHPSPPLP